MARAPRTKTPKPELEVVPEPMVIPPAPPIVEPAPVEAQADTPPAVGDQLRRERERRGISIDAVAQMLKIRRVYLRAIEESNWAELPEPVYVNGFIRSYASFLGLNVQHAIPAAKTEIINLPAMPKLEIPRPIDDQQLPSASTIIFAILGLLFLYGLWTAIHSDSSKPAPETPPIADETTADAPVAAAAPAPNLLNGPALVQSSDDTQTTTPAPAVTAAPAQALATPAPDATPPKPAAPAATIYGAPNPTRATITATGDSWIEIQTPKKETVFSGVLRAGDSYRVPDNATLLFSTTNLSGLKFDLDGAAALPPTDAQNTVEQPLSLSPDNFLKAAVRATPAPKPIAHTPKPRPTTAQHTAAPPQPNDAEDSISDYPDDQ